MVMNNKKRVFWEALILTILIFVMGFLMGILFENNRIDIIQENYANSQNSLMDLFTLSNLANLENVSCDNLIEADIAFANRIYDEAKILESYEQSGKFSDDFKVEHKKYDIMRTLLWTNTLRTQQVCDSKDINVVVYLYNNNPDDLTEKAENSVWQKILSDLKAKEGDSIILIPIAVDTDVSSLDFMLANFNMAKYPSLLINNKIIIDDLSSVEDIEGYLN